MTPAIVPETYSGRGNEQYYGSQTEMSSKEQTCCLYTRKFLYQFPLLPLLSRYRKFIRILYMYY